MIESARGRAPIRFEEVFVDGDEDLERAYGLRVPVVVVNGVEVFEYHVDAGRLRRLLAPPAGRRGVFARVRRR